MRNGKTKKGDEKRGKGIKDKGREVRESKGKER